MMQDLLTHARSYLKGCYYFRAKKNVDISIYEVDINIQFKLYVFYV